jgi:hypothetical protein
MVVRNNEKSIIIIINAFHVEDCATTFTDLKINYNRTINSTDRKIQRIQTKV